MGKLLSLGLSAMFAFFLISMLAAAFYDASPDDTKQNFTLYQEKKNWSELDANLTMDNSEDVVSNMQLQSEVIANKIGEAQTQLSSGDITQQLLGAFGILSALSIDVLFLLLFIMLDGVNFIGGIGANISLLPTPFNMFGILVGFAISIFIVYAVGKIAAAVLKVDI